MSRLTRALSAAAAFICLFSVVSHAQTISAPVGLGTIAIGQASAASTLTFSVPATATFSLSFGTEFIVSNPVCSGGTCSVSVVFQPAYPGLRRGAVAAYNGGSTPVAIAPVYGIGSAPQLNVGPGLISTIASRTSAPLATTQFFGVAAKNANQIYAADSFNHVIFLIDRRNGQATVVAGTYLAPGFSGDGGAATAARLNQPSGLAIDPAGNLLIADTNNYRIRKLDTTTGIITTVAGNGQVGFSGDGGPAVNASFNSPSSLAVYPNGDILICDLLNQRIRLVSAASGNISTFAGSGVPGFAGDGGPAVNAQMNNPTGLAIDLSGNVFIAEPINSTVRVVAAGTGIITTFAGQGGVAGNTGDGGAAPAALLNFPYGVLTDAAGDVFIASTRSNSIRKVSGDAGHTISTVVGQTTAGYSGDGGSALTAKLNAPTYLTQDELGNIYFVDSGNLAIRSVTAAPAPLTFPLTAVGSTAQLTLILSNTGNQGLNVAAINFPAGFTAVGGGTCTSTTPSLAPGASCTLAISFIPTSGGATSGSVTFVSNSLNTASAQQLVSLSESNGLYFIPVTPCRVVDTRLATGPFGAPFITGNTSRDFAIRNSNFCSGTIPGSANVQAYSLNVTVVPHGSLSFVSVYPKAATRPEASLLNSYDGRNKANAAIVPANTGDTDRAISVYASADTEVIIDINGYYVPETEVGALAYYPLPPCRVADTRESFRPSGLGPPTMAAGESRNFPVLSGNCNIPAEAQAYALNFTAIPQGPLPYLITWPTGQPQPVVSTLNATTGAVTANAAIVKAGSSGNISVYTTTATEFIIDVSGYYAPKQPGDSGLALYNVSPCRAYDTRTIGAGTPIIGIISEDIRSGCSVPAVAQGFVLNSTVIPAASLSYLTLWARGSSQPVQSTLNAYDSAVTSNLAVVPTSDGFVTSLATANTGLILDLYGYFAP